jgi:hypothetical protein
MDPNELIKAAPAIAKGAGALAAAIPFTAIVKKMLGAAADELAEMWRDQVRLYRYERQLKCVEKAERMAHEAGFTPQAVPPKILFPLLEGASFEEDENLHDMWAALLTNAASPENGEKVRPGFLVISKQLAPDEALILQWMLDQLPTTAWRIPISYTGIEVAYERLFGELKLVGHRPIIVNLRCRTCVSGLVAAGLVEKTVRSETDGDSYAFTWYGFEFVAVCQPPKPKS